MRSAAMESLIRAAMISAAACGGDTTPVSADGAALEDSAPVADGSCLVVGQPDASFPDGALMTWCMPPNDPFTVTIVGDPSACAHDCQKLCGPCINCTGTGSCEVEGGVVTCYQGVCAGRRHEGVFDPDFGESTAELLARAAYYEAVSIASFRILARELRAHGAPQSLVRAARSAARDEARHARVMTTFTKKFGGTSRPLKSGARRAPRSLTEIALENAVEGCASEMHAALIATWQSEHAADLEIREAMRVIARDEACHAALAWELAEWVEPRLSSQERLRVRTARARRLAALMIAKVPSDARLGLPSIEVAQRLARALVRYRPSDPPGHGRSSHSVSV